MAKLKASKSLFLKWLQWRYLKVPKDIVGIWGNFFSFIADYFSVKLLFKALFAHWRKQYLHYGKAFNLKRYSYVFLSNLSSRVIGFVVRISLIIFAVACEVFIAAAGLVLLFLWIFLPLFVGAGIFLSFKILGLW